MSTRRPATSTDATKWIPPIGAREGIFSVRELKILIEVLHGMSVFDRRDRIKVRAAWESMTDFLWPLFNDAEIEMMTTAIAQSTRYR